MDIGPAMTSREILPPVKPTRSTPGRALPKPGGRVQSRPKPCAAGEYPAPNTEDTMTQLTKVKSSAVNAHGYDADTGILTIESSNGKPYRYAGVPPETAAAFAAAESIGRAWGSMIRGKFDLVDESKA